MGKEVHELLIAARARIADPKHWVKGVNETKGKCYCAFGALKPKENPDTYRAAAHILETAIPHTANLSSGSFRAAYPVQRSQPHETCGRARRIRPSHRCHQMTLLRLALFINRNSLNLTGAAFLPIMAVIIFAIEYWRL